MNFIKRAVYTPTEWQHIQTAPLDGTVIILRNPNWTHDIVAQGYDWQDDSEGWNACGIAIAKDGNAASKPGPIHFEPFDMEQTKWAIFAPTPQMLYQLAIMDALEWDDDDSGPH